MTNKEHHTKQLIIFVIALAIVIILLWVFSWHWIFNNNSDQTKSGSLSQTIDNISEDWQKYSQEFGKTKMSINKFSNLVKDRIAAVEQTTDKITSAVLNHVTKLEADSWPLYESDNISFNYPTAYQLIEDGNQISLLEQDQEELVFKIYENESALPDNINNLSLVDWLKEQVTRDLGIFIRYELSKDLTIPYSVYKVESKDRAGWLNYFWQTASNDGIIWLALGDDNKNLNNLVISSIK